MAQQAEHSGPGEALADDQELLRRYHRLREPAVREELVRRYLPFARSMALRYRGGSEPTEDLIQVASLGLVNAIDRFDPDRGIPFVAFAAPTVREIAVYLELPEDEVLEAFAAGDARRTMSLDQPVGSAESEELTIGERIGAEEAGFEGVEQRATIAKGLPALSERERLVLRLRFVEDMTQSQIAERIGHSQMHVSRILRAALERLRTAVEEE